MEIETFGYIKSRDWGIKKSSMIQDDMEAFIFDAKFDSDSFSDSFDEF